MKTVGLCCRSTIIFVLAIFLLALFEPLAQAVILKWTDDRGAVHFTDDINTIPKKFRVPPYLVEVPGFFFPRATPEKSKNGGNVKQGSEKNKSDDAKKKETGGLTKEERALTLELVSFLKSQVTRDETLTRMMPSERTGKTFVASIRQSLPQKKQFSEKLSKFELPALQEVRDFLQTSLEQDEQVRVTGPRMKSRTVHTLNRLKQEMGTESRFIDQLEELLKADDEEPSPQAKEDMKADEVPSGDGGEEPAAPRGY